MGEEKDRARRDVDALTEHLNRLVGSFVIPHTLVAAIRRRAAEQLVTWGWTNIGPGEQVTAKPTPRNGELSLRDELAATIAGVGGGTSPVALAKHLVNDGWTKLEPEEKVVTPLTPAESHEIVQQALWHWEQLKKAAKDRRLGSAEVSADASELTSGVKKHDPESLILAVFARSVFPLTRVEACDRAAETNVDSTGDAWDRWRHAFNELVRKRFILRIGTVTSPKGEKLYIVTAAGRDLHELDGAAE